MFLQFTFYAIIMTLFFCGQMIASENTHPKISTRDLLLIMIPVVGIIFILRPKLIANIPRYNKSSLLMSPEVEAVVRANTLDKFVQQGTTVLGTPTYKLIDASDPGVHYVGSTLINSDGSMFVKVGEPNCWQKLLK